MANAWTKVLPVIFLLSAMISVADDSFPSTIDEYPIDAALSKARDGHWIFRSFPEGSLLYIYAEDSHEKSNCIDSCSAAWPPLLVSSMSATNIGNWSIIIRTDGRKQWAYKGQPVYRRYHDLATPGNRYEKYGFYLLKP